MGRRNRKSKRKVNSLLTMVVLTAILMVTSTYAWFSANREVSITGITAKVKAAEGLQISLDGEKCTYDPDILSIVNKFVEKAEVNPHLVNPEYLKLTEAEESRM